MLFDKINEYFIEREFERIPTDSETVKMYATYQKSSLYLINLIELDHNYILDIQKYMQYKILTKNQFTHINSDKVILVNIILIDDAKRVYDEVNIPPQLEEDFIDINWIIDTSKNELVIPSNQINSVIRLEKDLEAIIGADVVVRLKLTKKDRLPILTLLLMLINIGIWLAMEALGGSYNSEVLIQFGALYAPLVIEGGEYWRLFTANFIHIGATHLFFNCFSLFIFGSRLEKYISRLQFTGVYLGAALFGTGFSLTSHLFMDTYAISAGASGAIYGLIGSIIICSKLSGKSIDGLSDYIMIIFFILGIAISIVSPNVDISAHIGGFIGGILFTFAVLRKSKDKTPALE
ncbi:MAG: hypothetical protein CVU84_15415 [Firmicutes bacterium HGW-Firmicutes-1]|jgi:rhomboid protease GluP|nr:MAG: hypothetical protein CVU84_15415 [Firmicutes bacterium HGW-Firmicutes-1]